MAENFERLNRTLIKKGHVIDYYVDTVQLPNGKQAEWDFIKHKGAAAIVPVTRDGKILMVRQYRNALDRYTLEVPAGGRNTPQESTLDCAARELEEETGYRSEKLELLVSLKTTVAFCDELIDVYVATDLKPSHQNLDEDEFVDVKAYSLEELLDKIFQCEIQDSKTVSAILAYKVKLDNSSKL